jgi:hypothetical protein
VGDVVCGINAPCIIAEVLCAVVLWERVIDVRQEELVKLSARQVAQLGIVVFRSVWKHAVTVEVSNLSLPISPGASVRNVEECTLDLQMYSDCCTVVGACWRLLLRGWCMLELMFSVGCCGKDAAEVVEVVEGAVRMRTIGCDGDGETKAGKAVGVEAGRVGEGVMWDSHSDACHCGVVAAEAAGDISRCIVHA